MTDWWILHFFLLPTEEFRDFFPSFNWRILRVFFSNRLMNFVLFSSYQLSNFVVYFTTNFVFFPVTYQQILWLFLQLTEKVHNLFLWLTEEFHNFFRGPSEEFHYLFYCKWLVNFSILFTWPTEKFRDIFVWTTKIMNDGIYNLFLMFNACISWFFFLFCTGKEISQNVASKKGTKKSYWACKVFCQLALKSSLNINGNVFCTISNSQDEFNNDSWHRIDI